METFFDPVQKQISERAKARDRAGLRAGSVESLRRTHSPGPGREMEFGRVDAGIAKTGGFAAELFSRRAQSVDDGWRRSTSSREIVRSAAGRASMAISRTVLAMLVAAGALIGFAMSQTPAPEGRVTSIFHDVQVLPTKADARPAEINDKVDEGTALRTGGDSRSELTFADLTITRLGENTIFSFNRAGRSVRLDSGSILLYARKNSGAAEISTKAVSVGITGTTIIFESKPAGYDRLIVLEGNARFSLNDYPDQSMEVHGGQLLNVKAGAKKLPKPGRVDLRRIIRTHPLIKNFPPLPSLDLILSAAEGRNPNRPPPPVVGKGPQGGPS